jgi:predicted protein tyrosine phosphatase
MNPRLMGQVFPGLWVGELSSITEIRKRPPTLFNDATESMIGTATAFFSATAPTISTTTTTTKWTIISLLKSEKLSHFVHSTLNAIQKEAVEETENEQKQQQQQQRLLQHQHQNDGIFASGVQTAASTYRIMIQQHVEWEIKDQIESDFLSPRLEEILNIIDEALGDNDKEASHESTSFSLSPSSSSPPISSCCLVHCALGISRSAALCAAYLLWKRHDETLQAALTRIRAVRPQAAPNLGFIACLRALEQCHGNVAAARKRMASKNATLETTQVNIRSLLDMPVYTRSPRYASVHCTLHCDDIVTSPPLVPTNIFK